MPTYTFARTREQMCTMVLKKLGVYEAGQTGDADEVLTVYEGIDLRLKEMHGKHILWWQVAPAATSVTFSAATATLPADLLFPIAFSLRIGTDDTAMEIIDHVQYQALQNKGDTGEPAKVFVSGQTAYLWPVPDATYTGRLTYEAIAADTAINTAPDIPVSMVRALSVIVASDLADSFSVPEAKVRRLIGEAQMAQKDIAALNVQRVDSSPVTPEYF